MTELANLGTSENQKASAVFNFRDENKVENKVFCLRYRKFSNSLFVA